jgi:hypothetical protein
LYIKAHAKPEIKQAFTQMRIPKRKAKKNPLTWRRIATTKPLGSNPPLLAIGYQ